MGKIDGNAQVALPQTEANYANVDITDDFMFAYVMQRRPQGQDTYQRGHVIMPDRWI